jgi:Asp-tRNA(Asn)/Glu-tRNA(Gln) amidotransferase C subunit
LEAYTCNVAAARAQHLLSKDAFKLTLRPDTVSEGGRASDVLANAKHKDMDFFVAPKAQGAGDLE